MVKKTTVKPPAKKATAKRKPAKKKPVTPKPVESVIDWKRYLTIAVAAIVMLGIGGAGGVWSAGGIEIGPGHSDVLSKAYDADRLTQIAVLTELAAQPFDGATDDGRRDAGEWFNANRFRGRAVDFGGYTDAVAEAIAANSEADLAKKLEAK
jgi:hypothetical protein